MLDVQSSDSRPITPGFSTRDAGSSPEPRWFLIQTRSCQEHKAARFLSEWAETLLPLVPEVKRITKERQPLFTGYVFSRFDPGYISKANGTFGVTQVVRFGLTPAIVADELITEIRTRLDENSVLKLGPAQAVMEGFHHGDKVSVVAGPLRGVQGIFDCRLSGKERAHILLATVQAGAGWSCTSSRKPQQSFHGGSARVQVDMKDLARIG